MGKQRHLKFMLIFFKDWRLLVIYNLTRFVFGKLRIQSNKGIVYPNTINYAFASGLIIVCSFMNSSTFLENISSSLITI